MNGQHEVKEIGRPNFYALQGVQENLTTFLCRIILGQFSISDAQRHSSEKLRARTTLQRGPFFFLEKSENNFQNLRRSWAIYLTKLSCLALNKSVRPLNKMQKTSSRRAAILCRIVLDEFLTTEDNPCTLGKLKNSTTFQRGLILGKVL